jgi:pimeloyl-ACP methyl ester carboxylesterase
MPPADRQLPFADDLTKEVQIVPRNDAETVVLLFCGNSHRLGMPLSAIHRWLGLIPASLVYLRDFRRLSYLTGLSSLGPDREATLTSLRGIIASLGGRRTVCCGNSGGGFAALHYGLDLGSEAVLGLSGATNLSPDFNMHLRQAVNSARLRRDLPPGLIDLRRLYGTANRPPRALLLYGQNNWDDRLQAEYLSGLPTVTLKAVEDHDEHNVVVELIKRGQFEGFLDWLVRV